MRIELVVVCEDPTFGVRGSRKFWSACYATNPRGGGAYISTSWGRIPEGREINVKDMLRWPAQRKDVMAADDDTAIKFIDKKAREKMEKGYKIVVHTVDGVNLAILHGTAADAHGFIHMATYRGT